MAGFTAAKPSDDVVQAITGDGWKEDTLRNQANPGKNFEMKSFPADQNVVAMKVAEFLGNAGVEGGYSALTDDGSVTVRVNDRAEVVARLNKAQESGKWTATVSAQTRQGFAKQ